MHHDRQDDPYAWFRRIPRKYLMAAVAVAVANPVAGAAVAATIIGYWATRENRPQGDQT